MRDEVERGARLLDVREQLLDPAGRGGRRAADEQPVVDLAHGGGGDVVHPVPLVERAGPEHLEVRFVPDLEGPVLEHLVDAVAVDDVLDEVAHQVVPAVPVLGWGDDRGVVEHRLRRVAGQVVRHEGDLDDRVEPERPDVVVDPVHAGEVVHRLAVDLAVDPEVVAEDAVRPHRARRRARRAPPSARPTAPRRSRGRRWCRSRPRARGARCRSSAATGRSSTPASPAASTATVTGPASASGVAATRADGAPCTATSDSVATA